MRNIDEVDENNLYFAAYQICHTLKPLKKEELENKDEEFSRRKNFIKNGAIANTAISLLFSKPKDVKQQMLDGLDKLKKEQNTALNKSWNKENWELYEEFDDVWDFLCKCDDLFNLWSRHANTIFDN